jgi:hypothetical protein
MVNMMEIIKFVQANSSPAAGMVSQNAMSALGTENGFE